MKLTKLAGATSEIWQIFIADSSSTTGAGLTGLVFNTASLTCYYHRDTDTTATAMTLVTMTVGTFTSLGFKEIDATNMPGWYQLCPPNAALASGAKSVAIHLKGATNMAPLPIEVQLTAVNPDSATAFMTSVATVTTVTNQLTAAQIATGIWQDATAGDFTTASSIGKSLYTSGNAPGAASGLALVGSNVGAAASVTAGVTVTTNNDKTGYALTAGERTAIATAHWQDATAGDFTVAGSIGKSLFTSGNAPGAASGLAIVGSNMGTVASVTGNVNGSTASIGANGLDAAALATDAVTEIVTAIFARAFSAAYGSYTFDQIIKIILAVEAGKVSGLDVGAPAFRNIADNGNVLTAVTDVDGNRTSVTITP